MKSLAFVTFLLPIFTLLCPMFALAQTESSGKDPIVGSAIVNCYDEVQSYPEAILQIYDLGPSNDHNLIAYGVVARAYGLSIRLSLSVKEHEVGLKLCGAGLSAYRRNQILGGGGIGSNWVNGIQECVTLGESNLVKVTVRHPLIQEPDNVILCVAGIRLD